VKGQEVLRWDGRFRLTGLGDLAYRILVFEPKSPIPCVSIDEVRPTPEDVTVVLERRSLSSAFLEGKVLLAPGSPARGAELICYSRLSGYRTAFADGESGGFRIGPLPPGGYRLEVQFPGASTTEVEVEALEPDERRDLGRLWASGDPR